VERDISWEFLEVRPQHLPQWMTTLVLSLDLWEEESHGGAVDGQPPQSQHLIQQQADTLWEIKHGGDVIAVKSLDTTHFVPMLSRRKSEKEREALWWTVWKRGRLAHRQAPKLSGPVNGHLSSGVRGSWGYPQRHGEVKWVTVFEVRPAVIAPNIQQMSGSAAR